MARKEKQEVMIIVLSMFLAFLLWAYVMGDSTQDYTTTIKNVPVKLVNEDSIKQNDYILVPEQKITVDVEIKGSGYSGFNVSPEEIKVEADLQGYPLRKGKNTVPYKVVDAPRGIKVIDQSLKLISIELDSYIEKSVPVTLDVTGNVKEGYGYLPPSPRPSEVLISGPESYVNSVTHVLGVVDIVNTTTKDINPYIHVKPQGRDGKPVSHVEVEPKYVSVVVTVKPSKTVPITVKTAGKSPNDKVYRGAKPKTGNLTIIGDAEVLDKITEIQTVAVDLSKLTESTTREIFLNVPAGVIVANDLKSIDVDFTVENKIQKDFSVNISTINQQEGFNYEINTKTVTFILYGPESEINSFDSKKLSAVVDLKDILEGTHSLEIIITKPEEVEMTKYSPDKVSVVVTKK